MSDTLDSYAYRTDPMRVQLHPAGFFPDLEPPAPEPALQALDVQEGFRFPDAVDLTAWSGNDALCNLPAHPELASLLLRNPFWSDPVTVIFLAETRHAREEGYLRIDLFAEPTTFDQLHEL